MTSSRGVCCLSSCLYQSCYSGNSLVLSQGFWMKTLPEPLLLFIQRDYYMYSGNKVSYTRTAPSVCHTDFGLQLQAHLQGSNIQRCSGSKTSSYSWSTHNLIDSISPPSLSRTVLEMGASLPFFLLYICLFFLLSALPICIISVHYQLQQSQRKKSSQCKILNLKPQLSDRKLWLFPREESSLQLIAHRGAYSY